MTYDATASLSYTFDQENRLTGAAGYTYTYDGDGNRVRKSTGSTGTLYWYMTPGIVGESDLSGNLTDEYIFFNGERVARKSTNGVFYYFSDRLKTASVITDSQGNIKSESDFYPWGGELQFVSDSNHYKFTGKERDQETGLDYYGARYYSNGLGRWVSADWSPTPIPIPYADFHDPQTLNLYQFVGGNPASKADPDGHDWPSWSDVGNFITGAANAYGSDNLLGAGRMDQGTSTVGFTYDTANRRSTLTLSNGVNMVYTYDNDSRVTGITYKFNANTLGNLTYTYDSLGRRTQVGGSFAQTGLPATVTSTTYDAANELTNWNGTPISYDLNGNMLSDGANTFSWNARNQVATLNNVSLHYDGFGRRSQNAAGKTFFYDGPNATQELTGSTVTANLLSGGVDEVFTRADSSGTFTPLQDGLGSTIALVDSSGNVQTSYAYDLFGNTTVSGAASANASQYTGRENEGNGLYFLRARYYSPVLHRFISQDPLGFVGSGPNFYEYAFNSPINFADRSGLAPGDWWDPVTYKTLPTELNPFNPNGTFSQEAIAIGQSAHGIITGNWAQVAAAAPNTPLGMTEMYGRSCDKFSKYVGYYGVRGALIGASVADILAGTLIAKGLIEDILGKTGPSGPKPPGWNENWEWRYPEGNGSSSPRWFDESGGEWRYHGVDSWHSTPHWDFNPWTEWNSAWQNIRIP